MSGACMTTGPGLRLPPGYGVGETPAKDSLWADTRSPQYNLALPLPEACLIAHSVMATGEKVTSS